MSQLSTYLCKTFQAICALSNTIIICIHSFFMYPFKYNGIMHLSSYWIDMGVVSKDTNFN